MRKAYSGLCTRTKDRIILSGVLLFTLLLFLFLRSIE